MSLKKEDIHPNNLFFTVKVERKISNKDMSDILISIVEGNFMSQSWARFDGEDSYDYGTRTPEDVKARAEAYGFDTYCAYGYLPGMPMCAVLMQHHEDGGETTEVLRFDRIALERGLRKMADQYPANFTNLLDGDYDAIDCDILLQLALLGEVIYG